MKNLTLKRALSGLVLSTLFSVPALTFGGSPKGMGMAQVTVVNAETREYMKKAPLYIYGITNSYVGGKEINESETLTLPAGKYRISCALIQRTQQMGASETDFERWASHEATFVVTSDDVTSVILTMNKLDESISTSNVASSAQLRKMGIDAGLIQDTASSL